MTGRGYHVDVGTFAPDAYPHFANDPRAACKGTDPDAWFPERDAPAVQTEVLKRICARCPLRRECREWAVGQPWLYGVWGGTTRKQRRVLRRAHSLAARLLGVAG